MEQNTNERKVISLADVIEAKKNGNNQVLDELEVKGTVTIFDKDGNVKSTFDVENIDNAT